MYSVFLVEDEIVIRDGLKNSFKWEEYGFVYAGDADDGEMALPLIRQTKPDVLITDIRMPFMDGISLSKIVKKELPDTRIIIISGFDDFTYAQEAISIGVDSYLLKPVTKDKLGEVMTDARQKLDAKAKQENYLELFQSESEEYEKFSRNQFFSQLVSGVLSVSDIYEKSQELNVALDAKCYNIVLLDFTPMTGALRTPVYSKHMARLSDQLMQFLKCCPEFITFHWNLNTYAIIVKGDEGTIAAHTDNLIENITRRCSIFEDEIDWHLAAGKVISRFSEFPACTDLASRKLGCRYMNPEGHIFTDEDLQAMESASVSGDNVSVDQRLVGLFLENAQREEIDVFLDNLIPVSMRKSLNSTLLCRYFAMSIYMCVCDFIKKLQLDPGAVLGPTVRAQLEKVTADDVIDFVRGMFVTAILQRQNQVGQQSKSQLAQAMRYVDEHFADSGLSLNEVAKVVNISPSYLSAMFSKETQTTFVEYMTKKRMEKACYMLAHTSEKSQTIAEEIGYKDPHYFSYIFKKSCGCSPKEYRAKVKNDGQ